MMMLLEIGSELPDIKTVDQDGRKTNLKEFVGKPTVIYFYPMDDTPGCTKEACSFRDSLSGLKEVNVVGVSTQGVESHQRFIKKYKLNFMLIADNTKKVSKAFGTLKATGTDLRSTFIFDKDGILKFVHPSVTPDGHAKEIIAKLKELNLI